jgi:hypothetical protein
MAVVVSLRKVVEAIEILPENAVALLDPQTGEIVTVTEEDQRLIEQGREEDAPEWQRKLLPKIREALESGRFLPLPDKFEIHEWSIMERFSKEQEDDRVRDELLGAIHGAGAFRRFKAAIPELGIEDAWYRFREQALEEIAREWLESHKLPYK